MALELSVIITTKKRICRTDNLCSGELFLAANLRISALGSVGDDHDKHIVAALDVLNKRTRTAVFDIIRVSSNRKNIHQCFVAGWAKSSTKPTTRTHDVCAPIAVVENEI